MQPTQIFHIPMNGYRFFAYFREEKSRCGVQLDQIRFLGLISKTTQKYERKRLNKSAHKERKNRWLSQNSEYNIISEHG